MRDALQGRALACRAARPILAAAAAGELPREQRQQVFAHLARCMQCRREFGSWRRQRQALAGLAQPLAQRALAPSVGEEFFADIRREVRRATAAMPAERPLAPTGRRRWGRRLGVVAAAVLVVGAGLLLGRPPADRSPLMHSAGLPAPTVWPRTAGSGHGELQPVAYQGLMAQQQALVWFEADDGPPLLPATEEQSAAEPVSGAR